MTIDPPVLTLLLRYDALLNVHHVLDEQERSIWIITDEELCATTVDAADELAAS